MMGKHLTITKNKIKIVFSLFIYLDKETWCNGCKIWMKTIQKS